MLLLAAGEAVTGMSSAAESAADGLEMGNGAADAADIAMDVYNRRGYSKRGKHRCIINCG